MMPGTAVVAYGAGVSRAQVDVLRRFRLAALVPRPRRVDVVLCVAVAAVQLGATAAARGIPATHRLDALAVGMLLLGPVLLAWRRQAPVAVLALVFVLTFGYRCAGFPAGPVFLSLVVAFVSVLMAGHRRIAAATLAIGYASILWLSPLISGQPLPDAAVGSGVAAWLIALGTGVEFARIRRQRREDIRVAAAEHRRRRAVEERLQIARELHDVLAHSIAVINVQSGVGLHLIDKQPEKAREALSTIKRTSGEVLTELRDLLGTLRGPETPGSARPLSPAPGVARLDELLATTRAAGLAVDSSVTGRPRPLSAAGDLAVYRLVQESLTNVVRHAPGARASVSLDYTDADLRVQVHNSTSPGQGASGEGSGNGIPGMAERVHALGGEFHAGPVTDDGFTVDARIPLTSTYVTMPT